MNLRIVSFIGYVLMVIPGIGLLLLNSLFADSLMTAILQIVGAALMCYARMTFGLRSFHLAANPTNGKLVTTGPYRFIRHPIYTAILIFISGGVISHLSPESVTLFIVCIAGVFLRIYCEEKMLIAVYPEYKDYSDKTKYLIPFII